MSNFCMNCGAKGTLQPATEHPEAFIERGEYIKGKGCYALDQEAKVQMCIECHHEMIDLSA